MNQRDMQLRRRIQTSTWILIVGLVLSGVTALPLQTELDALARWLRAGDLSPAQASSDFVRWILVVRDGLRDTYAKYPFMAYGTDWLAFAHIVIAIAFVGALRHPLRNSWLFTFGIIASVLIVPWALITGEVRGIPMSWRLIDFVRCGGVCALLAVPKVGAGIGTATCPQCAIGLKASVRGLRCNCFRLGRSA